jgi:tetrathionate reductase subunit A
VPGYGDDVFGPGKHMKREEDMYLRMVANVAFGDKEDGSDKVPAADAEEIRIFVESTAAPAQNGVRRGALEAIVGEELWPHVVYVLNRGGRFQGYAQAYKNERLVNAYNKMLGLYFENLVTTKHSMTGKPYLPYAAFMPGPTDCAGNLIDDRAAGFDMTLITYKFITQTKSRTIGNYWLNAVYPENFVEISTTMPAHGPQNGDMVRIVSATNPEGVWDLGNGTKMPMIGKVKALEGIRPGVVAFSLGHGHWAQGSMPFEIDGKTITMDARRSKGFHANAAMRVDPILGNTTLSDVVGGSAVFYQSQVKSSMSSWLRHVGHEQTTSKPSRTVSSRNLRFDRTRRRVVALSPSSKVGMPQHCCGGTNTFMPLRAMTATVARATSGKR